MLGKTPEQLHADPNTFGRLYESTVGAHLINNAAKDHFEISYWLDRNREVDVESFQLFNIPCQVAIGAIRHREQALLRLDKDPSHK